MPSSPTPAIPAPLNFRKSRRVSRSALFIPYLPFPLGCVGSFQSYIVTHNGSMWHRSIASDPTSLPTGRYRTPSADRIHLRSWNDCFREELLVWLGADGC